MINYVLGFCCFLLTVSTAFDIGKVHNLSFVIFLFFQRLQEECSTYQNVLSETTQMYEKKIMDLKEQIDYEKVQCKTTKEELVSINRAMVEQHSLQVTFILHLFSINFLMYCCEHEK